MADNIWSQERINQNQQINQDTTYPTRIDEQNIENNEHIKKKWLTMVFDNLFVWHDGKNNYKCHNNYIPQKLEDVSIWNMISTDKGFEFRGEEDFVAEVWKMIWWDDVKAWFENLASQFCEDLKSIFTWYANRPIRELSQSDYNHIIYQLDILCQNYMTLVPSDAYKSIWDISLYDHTKTVVANAVVLYHHFQNEKIKTSYSTTQVCEYSCTLIAWDFPSIQKYINKAFAISHGLAKRLRARSFVVQAINEAVIEYMIEKLNLSRANVLINAGGKFVIYSHKDVDISWLSDDINTFLIQKYHGDIKINMISQKMKIWDIFQSISDDANKSNIWDIFTQLFDNLSRHKWQIRSENNLKNLTNQLFDTGIQYDNVYEWWPDHLAIEWKTNIHLIEEKQIWEELTKNVSVYIIYRKDDKFFFDLKRSHEWLQSDYIYLQFNTRTLSNLPKKIVAKSINLYVPKEGDTIKEFDKILWQEQYLTLIKWDVDNMSIILKHWLEYIYSVSRFVQFSRFLELFFGTLTQKFLQNQYNDVYTIFSGWDDFEFIMPFSQSVDFIDTYQQEFNKFVWWSDYLHFSSSIVLFKDKMPIKTISQQWEEVLKSAKKAYKDNMKYSQCCPTRLTKERVWRMKR